VKMDATDMLIGAAIGAAGGVQGIALPGLLIVSFGFDLAVTLAYTINPNWFPGSRGLTLKDVLTTSAGTIAGWGLVRLLVPPTMRTNPAIRMATAAGFVLLPAVGRVPGRLRSLRPARVMR